MSRGDAGMDKKCNDRVEVTTTPTREECYNLCKNHADCGWYTWGEDHAAIRYRGMCMLCQSDNGITSHSGFNTYEIIPFFLVGTQSNADGNVDNFVGGIDDNFVGGNIDNFVGGNVDSFVDDNVDDFVVGNVDNFVGGDDNEGSVMNFQTTQKMGTILTRSILRDSSSSEPKAVPIGVRLQEAHRNDNWVLLAAFVLGWLCSLLKVRWLCSLLKVRITTNLNVMKKRRFLYPLLFATVIWAIFDNVYMTSLLELEPTANEADLPIITADSSWRPSHEWIEECISNVNQIRSEVVPFNMRQTWMEGYRLGDCIKLCKNCRPLRNNFANVYYSRCCSTKHKIQKCGKNNITYVKTMLDAYSGIYSKPAEDELVLHLRLGDVIEGSEANVTTMLSKGADPAHNVNYQSAILSVNEYLNNIAESGLQKVSIRGGSHYPNQYKKSRVYAGCLKRAIKTAGYAVTMQLDRGNPDADFYYMSFAKKIGLSSGGYSRIMGDLVKLGGGEIIGRQWSNDALRSSAALNSSSIAIKPNLVNNDGEDWLQQQQQPYTMDPPTNSPDTEISIPPELPASSSLLPAASSKTFKTNAKRPKRRKRKEPDTVEPEVANGII